VTACGMLIGARHDSQQQYSLRNSRQAAVDEVPKRLRRGALLVRRVQELLQATNRRRRVRPVTRLEL
jgi:hypothetical protein